MAGIYNKEVSGILSWRREIQNNCMSNGLYTVIDLISGIVLFAVERFATKENRRARDADD